MIDPILAMGALLAGVQIDGVAVVAPAMIFSPRVTADWNPDNGPAISHFIRGGSAHLYVSLQQLSFQITAWADVQPQARAVADAVFTRIHGATETMLTTAQGNVRFLWGRAQGFPQDVVDQETGRATVVCFYTVGLQL